jgi:tetratricopeptide (TPR) repeat protein
MKRIVLFLLAFLIIQPVFSQKKSKTDCYYIKSAYENFCAKKYKKTIKILTSFRAKYPKHPLVEEAHYAIGLAYFESGNLVKAEEVFRQIINKKDYPFPDSMYSISNCISYSGCPYIMNPEMSVVLQHESCIKLAEIGFRLKDYNKVWLGIYNADKYYRYFYGCGTGDQEENMRLALLYSKYYHERGKLDSAICILLPHSLEPAALAMRFYPEISAELLKLLNEKYTTPVLRKTFEDAIIGMVKVTSTGPDKHEVNNFYINFMGVKIQVAPTYLFGKTNNIEEVQQYVRSLDFYRNLTPDYGSPPPMIEQQK